MLQNYLKLPEDSIPNAKECSISYWYYRVDNLVFLFQKIVSTACFIQEESSGDWQICKNLYIRCSATIAYGSIIMFCYHSQLLPPIFLDLFTCNNQIHNYNTRSAMNYRTHAYRTNLKKITIYFIKDQKFGILCQQMEKIRSASIVLRKLLWNFYSISFCLTNAL
jgi:hypothetical protein